MNTDTAPAETVHADLAFLKAIVEGDDGGHQADFGAAYLVAGVAWGIQIILQWLGYAEILPIEGTPIYLAVVSVPTLVVIVFTTWQGQRRKRRAANAASRAITAVFNGAALANFAIIAAVLAAAVGQKAYAMIFIYVAVLFALQGACWFVVYRLRRRLWMLALALAWFASCVGMGFALGAFNIHAFIAIAAFDTWVLMALPGAVMLTTARKAQV